MLKKPSVQHTLTGRKSCWMSKSAGIGYCYCLSARDTIFRVDETDTLCRFIEMRLTRNQFELDFVCVSFICRIVVRSNHRFRLEYQSSGILP